MCLHFETQNAKPLEMIIIREWILKMFWNFKKKKKKGT